MPQFSNLAQIPKYAIIVAGGTGTRMGAAIPKQFMLLNGLPALMHTLLAFHNSQSQPDLILVLPSAYHEYWGELCKKYNFTLQHQLVSGGETRFHSVKNGLDLIPDDRPALVAVQDAVRPMTGADIIDAAYRSAAEHGNGVVAVKSRDSVRQLKNNVSVALRRDEIYLVQTPQTFQLAQLKRAYQQTYTSNFTDDASVVEAMGINIYMVEGSHKNIKVTFPEDIAIAELLLKEQAK